MNIQEGDEFDGKLLAAVVCSKEAKSSSWEEFNKMIPKSIDTVSAWFSNYKGAGEIELTSIGSAEQTMEIVVAPASAYEKTK